MHKLSFLEAKTAVEVLKIVQNFPQDTVILVDVDDTLITPASKTFRSPPYNQLIEDLKNKDLAHDHIDVISRWRLKRKVMLVDQDWPCVIDQLKKRFDVYALTKVPTGPYGRISSMEDWRFKELQSLRISFSKNLPNQTIDTYSNNPAIYNGIILTGDALKSQALFEFGLSDKAIVLIDDRIEQLQDVDDHVQNFTGIWFKGLEILEDKQDLHIYELQKHYLLKNKEWFEDEEIEEKIKKERCNF